MGVVERFREARNSASNIEAVNKAIEQLEKDINLRQTELSMSYTSASNQLAAILYNKKLDLIKLKELKNEMIASNNSRSSNSKFKSNSNSGNSNSNSGNSNSNNGSSLDWKSKFENAINNLSADLLLYLDSVGLEFSSAKNLQTTLNSKFNAGLTVDDKWGPKSQAALDLVLSQFPLNFREDTRYYPEMTGVIDLSGQYVPFQQVQELQEQTTPITTYAPSINLNRADIRAILSHYGYNPYDFTGELRKSFRKWLAGDKSLNIDFIDKNSKLYNDWVAPYTTFKKRGGTLISKNVIERFKKGGKKKVLLSIGIFDRIKLNIATLQKNVEKEMLILSVKLLQKQLFDIGAFGNLSEEKVVDGIHGQLTNKAIAKAKLMGYNINNNLLVTSSSQKEEDNSNKYYTEIDPKDRKEFAKWLYLEGKDNLLGNILDTGTAFIKNFTGIGSRIDLRRAKNGEYPIVGPSINIGEGTKKQLVALHLFDDHNISKKNDTIKHVIDKDFNGDYRWQQINGRLNVHNGRSIFVKAGTQPGEHIAGLYVMYETPDKYHISDTYNFNLSGTDYSKRLINEEKGSLYEKLRYWAGKYGKNLDSPLEVDIPKETVLKWYNDFKSGKGVLLRTKDIRNEYNNKGYVGFGRLTYL